MDDPVFRYFFGGEGEQGQSQKSNNLGSGVIVSEQGYILTNANVVEAADEIEVALADNRRAKAKVIGTDSFKAPLPASTKTPRVASVP